MRLPKQILDDIDQLTLGELKEILKKIIGKLYRLLGGNGIISYWLTIKAELGIK